MSIRQALYCVYNLVEMWIKKEGVKVDTCESVQVRNPVYLVRTNNYRALVIGYRDGKIVDRKYFLAPTQLEARHKAAEYVERWNKAHGKEKDDQTR